MLPALGMILPFVLKAIDKVAPDPNEAKRMKQELAVMAANNQMGELDAMMNVIVAEAKSADPWTSRARPAFLWVVYAQIMSAMLVALMSVWYPEASSVYVDNYRMYLEAIPNWMYGTMITGYLGYVGARGYDKHGQRKAMTQIFADSAKPI